MKIWMILLLVSAVAGSGCGLWSGNSSNRAQGPSLPEQPRQDLPSAAETGGPNSANSAKSEFIANDFLSVIVRVPDFEAGKTQFSTNLPKTRYGEILMEQLRKAGYPIVLGGTEELPRLSYSVDLAGENSPNVHTFFVQLGPLQLKRSYEIVGDRIAPVGDMLMAGIEAASLRDMGADPDPVVVTDDGDDGVGADDGEQEAESSEELNIQRINELLIKNGEWDPLDANMYESEESVYEPLFADSTVAYENISTQVLIFPNDSLVLGEENKDYLISLANVIRDSDDVVRVVGCSHGKSQLDNGNETLAKGRAIRVREELLLAGVQESSVLHEACWANVHFDQQLPRRGVVVMHLQPIDQQVTSP